MHTTFLLGFCLVSASSSSVPPLCMPCPPPPFYSELPKTSSCNSSSSFFFFLPLWLTASRNLKGPYMKDMCPVPTHVVGCIRHQGPIHSQAFLYFCYCIQSSNIQQIVKRVKSSTKCARVYKLQFHKLRLDPLPFQSPRISVHSLLDQHISF